MTNRPPARASVLTCHHPMPAALRFASMRNLRALAAEDLKLGPRADLSRTVPGPRVHLPVPHFVGEDGGHDGHRPGSGHDGVFHDRVAAAVRAGDIRPVR